MPTTNETIAVLMGGASAEREVSLNSGRAVLAALRQAGVDAHGVDARDELDKLRDLRPDKVFLALHGRGGEDGTLQGYLETLGLTYTGSGVLASALAMDKVRAKQLWLGGGLPTPEFTVVRRVASGDPDQPLIPLAETFGWPLMIKPAREGSSLGVAKVERLADLEPAWRAAAARDPEVLVEQFISGREYTVGVLNGQALPVIRLAPTNTFFDYDAKYVSSETGYHCPCGLPAPQEKAMQDLALLAFAALGAENWGRVDIMQDDQGRNWLLEVNTLPGMTDHSLVPMAAKAAGMDFATLILNILDGARSR